MKKRLLYLVYSLLFFLPALVSAQTASHVVISEIYGAGGNTGAVYNSDFIELYNPTGADVDISGWSVQYNSATGTAAFSGITVFPTGSVIKSHGFFLVQEQSGGSAGIALPTPDMPTTGTTNNFNLSGTAGKAALVNNSTIIGAKPTLPASNIVDLVSFGTTAVYWEGSGPAVAPSTTTSIERKALSTSTTATMAVGGADELKGNGFDDDDNANDFVVPTVINPQNAASPLESAAPSTTLTATPTSLDFGTTQAVGVASAAKTFVLSGTGLTAGATLLVTGPFTISATSAGTYGTTLTISQTDLGNSPTVYVKFTPTNTTAATGNIAITSGTATTAVSLTGTGTSTVTPATLTVTPTSLAFGNQVVNTSSASQFFNFSVTNQSDVVTATASGPYLVSKDGVGFSNVVSYSVAEGATSPKVYVQFTPTAAGAAAASTVTIASSTATASKTVALTGTGVAAPAAPTGTASHVVISEIYGAGGNTGAVYNSDYIELYNPTSADVDISNWSVQYNSATGTAAFSGITVFPAGSVIKAHGYFLVQEQGGTVGIALPTPDMATTGTVNNFNLSGTAGKVALVNNATIIAAKPTLPAANIVDLVSFGATAVYWEGTGPAVAPSTTTSIERKAVSTSTAATMAAAGSDDLKGNGFDDDDNANDFVVPLVMNPQNSSSTVEPALTPAYAATPTPLTFSQNVNTTSAGVAVTLNGTGGALPATSVGTSGPYLISKTATGGYTNTLTFTAVEMAAATKPVVYVQFTPTALGAANSNLYITGVGAVQQIIPLNGTGTAQPVPTLTATPTALTFSSTVGIAAAVQNYTLTATNITQPTTLALTGPYLISKDGITFSATLTFAANELNAAQTPKVYVQFIPTLVGANPGTVTQTTTGGGTVSTVVNLTGTGVAPPNSAPTLTAVPDQTVCYSTTTQVIALAGITPGSEATQNLTLTVTSNNPSLFSSFGALPVVSGASAISFTAANGRTGTAVVTIKLKDNGGTANGGVDTLIRTFNLTITPLPVITVTSDAVNNIVEKGSTATLTASGGGTGATYLWTATVAGNVVSSLTGPTITIRPSIFATYTATVTNACGTTAVKGSLGVDIRSAVKLETSNVLTPNGDGKNDYWVVRNIDLYTGNNVKVFDKTGKVVFTKDGYNNDWNGYYNGSPLPQGTYYYVVYLGTGAPYRGTLTVVRD